MAHDFTPLLRALDDMLQTHGELVALGHEKQRVIVAGDVERLGAIVQREMRLMQQSAAMEKKRAAAADDLAEAAGLSGELRVSALCALADAATAQGLRERSDRLRALLEEQRVLNSSAKALLETHIQFSDMMLGLLVGPEDPLNNIYGARGTDESTRRQTPGLFDKQA